MYNASKQCITLLLRNTGGAQFIASFIYASNHKFERISIWETLIFEAANFIEKSRGKLVPIFKMLEINNFMYKSGLTEHPMSVLEFT